MRHGTTEPKGDLHIPCTPLCLRFLSPKHAEIGRLQNWRIAAVMDDASCQMWGSFDVSGRGQECPEVSRRFVLKSHTEEY